MIQSNHQYYLSPGDLAWSIPYLYFQITLDIDLRICIVSDKMVLNTNTTNRLKVLDTKILYDSDK